MEEARGRASFFAPRLHLAAGCGIIRGVSPEKAWRSLMGKHTDYPRGRWRATVVAAAFGIASGESVGNLHQSDVIE